MNSRISEVKIRQTPHTQIPKHNWYKAFFVLDGQEQHWMVYDLPDELAVYAAFKEFINNCYPEGE